MYRKHIRQIIEAVTSYLVRTLLAAASLSSRETALPQIVGRIGSKTSL